jgi:hypothetical protein
MMRNTAENVATRTREFANFVVSAINAFNTLLAVSTHAKNTHDDRSQIMIAARDISVVLGTAVRDCVGLMYYINSAFAYFVEANVRASFMSTMHLESEFVAKIKDETTRRAYVSRLVREVADNDNATVKSSVDLIKTYADKLIDEVATLPLSADKIQRDFAQVVSNKLKPAENRDFKLTNFDAREIRIRRDRGRYEPDPVSRFRTSAAVSSPGQSLSRSLSSEPKTSIAKDRAPPQYNGPRPAYNGPPRTPVDVRRYATPLAQPSRSSPRPDARDGRPFTPRKDGRDGRPFTPRKDGRDGRDGRFPKNKSHKKNRHKPWDHAPRSEGGGDETNALVLRDAPTTPRSLLTKHKAHNITHRFSPRLTLKRGRKVRVRRAAKRGARSTRRAR